MLLSRPARDLATALLIAALLLILAPALGARTITNTAQVSWRQDGAAYSASSNTVSFAVVDRPVTISTFVAGTTGSTALTFAPSLCGGAAVTAAGARTQVAVMTAGVIEARTLHIGDAFYLRISAPQANRDTAAVDRLTTVITTGHGDRETIEIFETGANTGVFVGAVATAAVPPQPVAGDCRLSVVANETISVGVAGDTAVSPLATATLDVLADPFGLVFDSEDGSPVDGTSVTLVDALTGTAARVFAPDGVTAWPATVTTGRPVTDAAGQTYPLAPGEFRFPLAAPGQYRLAVNPPQPYSAPSKASPAKLAGLVRPDGTPLTLVDASYGGAFTLTSIAAVRVDVPVDRPAVAVSLTKSASRDRAQPGDVVFYTLVASNPDTHAKRQVTITDQPSADLRLRRDSIRFDGRAADPTAVVVSPDGRALTLALGTIQPGARATVTYAMTVRPDAPAGDALNKALVTDARGLTSFASTVVRIEADGLAGWMTLIGRITAGGCAVAGPHPGIPNVRVVLEDGSFAVTDAEGRYHFDGLVPGDHVAAAIEQTLPDDGRFVDCARSTRSAGSATSRFVSGQGGSLAVADFHAELSDQLTRGLLALAANRQIQSADITPKKLEASKPGEAPSNEALDPEAQAERAAAGADVDWLALGDGPPAFLFPGVDHNPHAPAVRVVIRHRPDQKVELTVDGRAAAKVAFDGFKKSANGAWAVSVWRGIPIEGEVAHLAASVRNPDGSVAARLTREVHFTGTPAEARLLPGQTKLVADGRTRPVVAVQILDRTGRPVHAGISGDFQLSAPYESAEALAALQGRALTGQGRTAPHWTVKGQDGVALIELAPTLVSGAIQLDFAFRDGQQTRRQTLEGWVMPGAQKWTLVGLAEGSVGAKTIADAMERKGRFDSDLGDHARVAFYAKGRVPGSALLTVAYDSAKQRDDQVLLGAIDPRAYYTVFADGSDRRFDAASRNKLYVRIESRVFTALFGDFQTGFAQTQLARYQRIATGVKAEARVGGLHAAGFAARIATAHRRDEIQGAGLSGPYRLSGKAIVANSESIRIEVRDRFRSEVIVDSRTLTRFVDYDVDLLAGTVIFKAPVLSRDAVQNPQFIVIDYETDPDATSSGAINAGGRVDLTTARGRIRIGVTGLSDTGNGPRTTLGGLDVKAAILPGTELRAEVAASRRAGRTDTAWLAEIERHDGRLDLIAYARSMDAGYGVGQTNGVEAGRRKFGLDARLTLSERIALTTSAWIDDSLTDAAKREAVQLHGEFRSGRNVFRAGFATLRDHLVDGTTATSTVLDGSVTQRLLGGRLELEGAASLALGDADSVDLPSRYRFAARYAVTSAAKLVGSYEIAHGSAIEARTGRIGVELTPWRGGRLTTQLGAQDIAEFGRRSFAAFGLAQSLDVSKHLTLDGTLDSNKVLSGLDARRIVNPLHPAANGGRLDDSGLGNSGLEEDFTAVTLGGTYRARRWTITMRGEWRDGEFASRKGLTFGAIRQLGEGSVLGSGVTWTRARGIDGSASSVLDGVLALAHRPAESPLAVLAKLEFRSDFVTGAIGGETGGAGRTALSVDGEARASRLIGSVSLNLSPRGRDGDRMVQRSEIGLFGAVRYTFDRYQGTDLAATALLGGIDAHIGLGSRFEIGGSATFRTQLRDRVTRFSVGPAVGFVPARDMVLTVGYNLTGFRDRDFSAARSTTRGVFATLRAKFDTSTLGFLGLGR